MKSPARSDRGPDVYRAGKAYTVGQAAHLAGTTAATVRRWLLGYEAPGHRMQPVFGNEGGAVGKGPLTVSFLQLIELSVVARFRAATSGKVSLDRLRRAHEYARGELRLAYPFATLQLFESGGHILHQFEEQNPGPGVLALDLKGQWVLPGIVREEREQLDFGESDPFAVRWFPRGREVPIVVDPRIAGGRPTIEHSGVTIDTIQRRWRARESIKLIAQDYELRPEVVEEALQYAA